MADKRRKAGVTPVRRLLRANARRLYQKSDLSQAAWAEMVGRSDASISRLLNYGEGSLDFVAKVAKRLDVDVREMFEPAGAK
jgi:predicted transcriptional regulator